MPISRSKLLILAYSLGLLAVLSTASGVEPPSEYRLPEHLWIKEHGSPATEWAQYANSSDPLKLSSSYSKLDIAYVVRSRDPDEVVNTTLIIYRNSMTRKRFLDNGTLLKNEISINWPQGYQNETNVSVEPFWVWRETKGSGDSYMGYSYYLFLATFDPCRYSGYFQLRVNVTGLPGGSSWQSPDGNPNVPWTFFNLPSESSVEVEPYRPGSPLRASSRINVTAFGQPAKGTPARSDYEILIDGKSWATGTCYGSSFFLNGRHIPRYLEPGTHTITVICGEVASSTPLITTQWQVELEAVVNATIPGGPPITLRGRGFPPNEHFSIYHGPPGGNKSSLCSGAISPHGNFTVNYSFPKNTSLGIHNLTASATQLSGPPTAWALVSLDPWSVNLTVQPEVLYQGEFLWINGSRYPADSHFEIYIDGDVLYSANTDKNGTFSHRVWTLNPDFSPGLHTISANATGYGGPPCGMVHIEVLEFNATLSVSPKGPHPGTDIRISGSGFPPNALMEVTLSSQVLGQTVSSHKGGFNYVCTIPDQFPLGEHQLRAIAIDYDGPTLGSLPINITGWPVEVEVADAGWHPGGWVSLTGCGMPPQSSFELTINETALGEWQSDADGRFQVTTDLPMSLKNLTYLIKIAVPGYSGPPTWVRTVSIRGWKPQLDLTPRNARPGEMIEVNGHGFPRERKFQVLLDGNDLGAGTTSSNGTLNAYIFLARNASTGTHILNLSLDFPNLTPTLENFTIIDWNPALRIQPWFGGPETEISLSATGFPPNNPIIIHWDEEQVKTVASSSNGSIQETIDCSGEENQYHHIHLGTQEGFTGSPSASAFFYLGQDPPSPSIYAANSTGNSLSCYFPNQTVFCSGVGLPPTEASLHTINRSNDQVIVTETINIGPGGGFHLPIMENISIPGTYGFWMDLNGNLIVDSNDQRSPDFECRTRPEIGLKSLKPDKTCAVQGEAIDIRLTAVNDGDHADDVTILLHHGETRIGSLNMALPPLTEQEVTFTWHTSTVNPGERPIWAQAQPLGGEIDLGDNDLKGPDIRILSPPEIVVKSLSPRKRRAKSGEVIKLEVVFENRGSRAQFFSFDLIWGEITVLTDSLTIGPGTTNPVILDWNTSGVSPGIRRIRVVTDSIPFEVNPSNNDLASGRIEIMPPNSLPTSIPGGPYEALSGFPLLLNGSSSWDQDGTINSYLWDLGDGSNATGPIIHHTYEGAGRFDIGLTVIDADGDSATGISTVQVLNTSSISISPCNENGTTRDVFSSQDDIYLALEAPTSIRARVYLAPRYSYNENGSLGDVSMASRAMITGADVSHLIWPARNSLPGSYDLVLDVDSDGIFNPRRDPTYSSFLVIPERSLWIALLVLPLILAIPKKECNTWTESNQPTSDRHYSF